MLDCLLAEAALLDIASWNEFCRVAKPKRSGDIAATVRRRRRMRAPQIPAGHVRACHGRTRLPARPTEAALDAWTAQIAACVRLHCPTIAEKVLYDERHAPRLLDRLNALLATTRDPGDVGTLLVGLEPLLATTRDPGDVGTLLVGLEPLLERLDRPAARAWHRANHQQIRGAKPCEPHAACPACPACVAGRPCPRDVIHQLLTRRALDYGTTAAGVPVSLLSKQVKKDLYYGRSARKIDTWPAQGLSEAKLRTPWVGRAQRSPRPVEGRRDVPHFPPRVAVLAPRPVIRPAELPCGLTGPGQPQAVGAALRRERDRARSRRGGARPQCGRCGAVVGLLQGQDRSVGQSFFVPSHGARLSMSPVDTAGSNAVPKPWRDHRRDVADRG